jgi:putative endonuclease
MEGHNRGIRQMKKLPAVYILASFKYGTLYIGVTGNLRVRTWQHREDFQDGFTAKYKVHALVYYEIHRTMKEAIRREKQLKKWNRAWKIKLIEEKNPSWRDLFTEI